MDYIVNDKLITQYVNLGDLEKEHELRNISLKKIMAECRCLESKIWRNVSYWKIKDNCFNDLCESWTKNYEWRIKI